MRRSVVLTSLLLAFILASAAAAAARSPEVLPEAKVLLCDDVTVSCARHLLGVPIFDGRRDGTVSSSTASKVAKVPIENLPNGRKLTEQASHKRKLLVAKKPVKNRPKMALSLMTETPLELGAEPVCLGCQ